MLQITKNDDELLKNYPFLQAIDKLESSKAHEHLRIFSDISIQNISCWTTHNSYLSYVYSKDKIDKDYYDKILIDFLLRELNKEARDTFYSNAFRCYNTHSSDFDNNDASNDRLLLEKYNDQPKSNFRRSTVMYIRESFKEWHYQQQPPLIPISDFDKKLNGELDLYCFVIEGRFGFQNISNKTMQEKKKIEHKLFTSTDIIPFVSSQVERI